MKPNTSTNKPLTLLLLVGVLLGCVGCVPRDMEKISQDQTDAKSNTKKAHYTPEEVLPDALIDRVKHPILQQNLRELRKNPATIDNAATGLSTIKRTVLQLAVIADEFDVIEGLLKAGANPNVILDSFAQETALLNAAAIRQHPNAKAIQALLEAGADALHQDYSSNTALHYVAGWEDVDPSMHKKTIALLLATEPDILINLKNSSRETPLDIARASGKAAEIISLLETQAHGQTRGQSLLEQALPGSLIGSVRDTDLRKCLRGLRKDPTQINNKGHANETLLLRAMRNNELEVFRALLKAGANPNLEGLEGRGGGTALYYAVGKNSLAYVEALIAANADLNQPAYFLYTPLHTAVEQAVRGSSSRGEQEEKIVELLAQQPGIDFNKENTMGLTPLAIAEKSQKQHIADILKKYGAQR